MTADQSNDGVLIAVPPGELIDKITILEIKAARLSAPAQLDNVRRQLAALSAVRDRVLPASAELSRLSSELKAINESLWDIEDAIRAKDAAQDFGLRFIELARSVYRTNDRRSAIKRQIDRLLGSTISDEKSYSSY